MSDDPRLSDDKIRRALYRRAVGMKITTTEIVIDGDKRRVKKLVRQIPPDSHAAMFWLENRCSDQWRKKPAPAAPAESFGYVRPMPQPTNPVKDSPNASPDTA